MTLHELAILLAALALAAPLARWLGIAAVLGYLVAGVMLGPFGAGALFSEQDAEQVLHFAEFGVVLLLFLIGLELRPKRLWAMRQAVFGLGSAQVVLTAFALGFIGMLFFDTQWQPALFAGAALALSSTAFALQVMEENGELQTRHGRLGFSVLLFQDIAAIPLIALAPYFAVSAMQQAPHIDYLTFAKGLATIAAVVFVGRYALDFLLRLVALSKVKEAMTAAALLTVVGVTLIMEAVGLSASLGAFIAGALLAESSYRHELEADIAPFEGLLLGIFFTAIGMSLNLKLLVSEPVLIALLTVSLIAVKSVILFGLGRWQGLEAGPARRLAFALSQGGEFAFVLLSVGRAAGVLGTRPSEILAVVVTLSMAMTPLLLMLYIGAFEITVGLSVSKRATRAAGAVADLVTQQDKPVDKTFLTTMSDVADAIFVPYSTSNLTLKITGVTLDANAKAKVKWSWQKGGTAPYQVNAPVQVPADLQQANTFLIHTELSVPHRLMLFMADNLSMDTMSITIKREYFFRPRTGDSVECSNCSS